MNLQELHTVKPNPKGRVICWFSCGAASFIATQLALKLYSDTHSVIIAYCDTGSEHEDNKRFLLEAEEKFGQKIKILKSPHYKNVEDVIRKTRYINGRYGARCTLELKKKLRENFAKRGDLNIFGYTAEEQNRLAQFVRQAPYYPIFCPLLEAGISHAESKKMLLEQGIALPAMYSLGYNNNNCIGCVKGGMGYWNKIRIDFPEVFDKMSKLEREIGNTVLTRKEKGNTVNIYLDELKPNMGRHSTEVPSCGLLCQVLLDDIKE